MAAREEFDRNENVYKQVALQEAEERQLRDQELERMRLEWMEQMRVSEKWACIAGAFSAELVRERAPPRGCVTLVLVLFEMSVTGSEAMTAVALSL